MYGHLLRNRKSVARYKIRILRGDRSSISAASRREPKFARCAKILITYASVVSLRTKIENPRRIHEEFALNWNFIRADRLESFSNCQVSRLFIFLRRFEESRRWLRLIMIRSGIKIERRFRCLFRIGVFNRG